MNTQAMAEISDQLSEVIEGQTFMLKTLRADLADTKTHMCELIVNLHQVMMEEMRAGIADLKTTVGGSVGSPVLSTGHGEASTKPPPLTSLLPAASTAEFASMASCPIDTSITTSHSDGSAVQPVFKQPPMLLPVAHSFREVLASGVPMQLLPPPPPLRGALPPWGIGTYPDAYLTQVSGIKPHELAAAKLDPLLFVIDDPGALLGYVKCRWCGKHCSDGHLTTVKHTNHLLSFWAIWNQHGQQVIGTSDPCGVFFAKWSH